MRLPRFAMPAGRRHDEAGGRGADRQLGEILAQTRELPVEREQGFFGLRKFEQRLVVGVGPLANALGPHRQLFALGDQTLLGQPDFEIVELGQRLAGGDRAAGDVDGGQLARHIDIHAGRFPRLDLEGASDIVRQRHNEHARRYRRDRTYTYQRTGFVHGIGPRRLEEEAHQPHQRHDEQPEDHSPSRASGR